MALDNFKKTSMRIDKANQRFLDYQNAKVGDVNGRELLVQITNNGVVEDQTGTTLKLNWQHENGNQGSTDFKAVDIKTGKYSLYYPKQMLYKGTVDASVEINSNGQITNTMNFKIIVHADVFNGEAGTVNGVFISLADVNKKLDDREKEYVELKSRQTSVETQFNDIQQDITDKDVISAPEIIAARNGEANLKTRLDKEYQEVSTQLAQTAGLGNYTETPIYKNGVLSKILKTDGTESIFTYNTDGTLNTVTETILDRTVLTKMNYKDGQFTSVTRVVGGEAITYPSTLIASIDNYLVDFQVDKLVLSRDAGRTYTDTLSIPEDLGIIKGVHVFDGGEILVMGHQKCYYSHDWENFTESSVLDIDGNVFTTALYDNFTINRKNPHTQMINGKEIYCWINYSIHEDAQYKNINIWYTTDKGKTIKSCYSFRDVRDDVDNPNLFARHGHNVSFNPNDNTFWAMTGDFTTNGVMESHVLKGQYDSVNDSWSWELVGSGDNYKWTMIEFRGDYVYYTLDHSWGGVMRCLLSDIGDTSKHVKIIKTPNDTIGLYMSDKGDMLVTQSVYGGTTKPRIFYYSEDWGETFHTIEGDVPVNYDYQDACYYGFWAPNSDGKILSGVWSLSHESLDQWDRVPSVFIDDSIRRAGFPNAFK